MGYLDDFFSGQTPEGRHYVRHDRWEWEDYSRLADEIRDFDVAEEDLSKVTPETAAAAMSDAFFSLMKYKPDTVDMGDLRPTHRINGAVFDEMSKLANHEALRQFTIGDPIGAALGVINIEPEMEVLFDKAKKAQDKARDLEKLLDEWADKSDQASNLEDDLAAALAASEDTEGLEQQLKDLQDQLDAMEQQARDQESQLDQDIDAQRDGISNGLKGALDNATKSAENEESGMKAWSPEGGSPRHMDPKKRIEMAKILDTERFRQIAEAFGAMNRLMLGEQRNKVIRAPQEVFSIERGDNIPHQLPQESLYRRHPILRKDWLRRFASKQLLVYAMRGSEKVAKGGVVMCVDSSSSMMGGPDTASKGLAITLLHLCRLQKRPFTVIDFAGQGIYKKFNFTTTEAKFVSDTSTNEHFEGPEAVLDYASYAINGGTHFSTPLEVAVAQLQEEFDRDGATTGDIVMVTDGLCPIPDSWMAKFKEDQVRLGFRVYGFAFGGLASNPVLQKLCDGRVVGLVDLLKEADSALRTMFGEL